VEEATEQTVWQAHKYTTNAAVNISLVPLPTLQGCLGKATSSDEKATVLLHTFFPPPPSADILGMEHATCLDELPHEDITSAELDDTSRISTCSKQQVLIESPT